MSENVLLLRRQAVKNLVKSGDVGGDAEIDNSCLFFPHAHRILV